MYPQNPLAQVETGLEKLLNKQQMKGTFTFTDGASNQTNLTKSSELEAKESTFLFAKNLFRKVKQLFVQEATSETIVESVCIDESIHIPLIIAEINAVIEAAIPIVVIEKQSYSSQLNYQLNIQQMNLFTYLRRAITSSEESLSGQFLEKFKNFLSVIVGTASDINAPLDTVKRDFGILSNLGGSQLLSSKIFNQQAMRSWASVMFLTLFTAFGTLAQTSSTAVTDLSVKKTISTQSPKLGQDVTYTIKVKNDGTVGATGVELTDILPTGVTFKSASVTGGATSNTTTAGVTTVIWNVGNVGASPAELTMTIVATVKARGLYFNTAEITKEVETDLDSTPNNKDINEDDQDAVCFSVEEYFYKGDEFTTALPAGYTNITWTKKVGTAGTKIPVTATTPGVKVLADGNLTITAVTDYTEFEFTASNKNCPITGCCPIKFIPGPLGSIGDFVFTDTNKDGIQNLGELGLAGIKVQLYKADGVTLVDEVTTDVNGKYLFDSLFTDSYKVKFILPSGSTFSPTGAGTTATDSDAGLNGFTGVINIDVEKTGIDKDNSTIDAGIFGNLGSIGDFVFRDDNSNGIQDATEPGIQGVVVNLYKGTILLATATTDGTGKYNFPGLSSGTDYQVEFVAPAQSKFTKPVLGGDPTKDSDAGVGGKSGLITIDVTKAPTDVLRNNPTIDAGIIPLGSIGDYVFNDNNKDGIQNAGDTPVAGLKVYLLDKDGNKIDSTNTKPDGSYKFLVPSGDYFVQFTKANGQSFSPTGAGTPSTDSDADLVTGKSGKVTIDATKPVGDPARDNTTVDAGLVGNLGSIGDFVFRDDNSNGIQDATEPGIQGVTVNLYKGTTLLATTTTDGTGKYNFPGLSSGTDYQVEFVAPGQSKFTTPSLGGDPTKDSNAGANGKSGLITIDVTKAPTDVLRNNPTIDAGIIPLGSIGDYVFNDNNGNGIQDAGDTKLPGVKVTLTDKDGNVLTSTTTDSDGKYEFIVPSGEYFVIFDKPTGSTFSPVGAGSPSTDSDADATGKSGKITIDASKPVGDPARNNTTVDAGVVPNKGTIGDFVFTDSNGNNKQDAGEAGLPGVTVELYDATGTTKLQTTTTDATGKYLFSGLESGGYKVKFVLPSGKTFVTPNTGTSAEDSDAGVGGFSGVINIDVTKPLGDVGRNNLTIDAGVKADCNINAGTLAAATPNFCLPTGGSVVLTATTGTAPTVPAGYTVKYVLTKGAGLVIQQVSNTPTFTVTATGEYRIHTLVYDANPANGSFLDLSGLQLGTTTGVDVVGIITDKKLCAALDVTGAKFNVNEIPAAPVFAAKTICGGEKVTIGDNGPAQTGKSYAWFTSATGGVAFATTQSVEVTPAVTTTYYVETTLTTPGACTSARGSVTVTVNPKPVNPVAKSTLSNDCTKNLQTVNLADAITTTPAGSVIEWHIANDPTSAIITNTTTAGAGTYYAFAKSTVGGCYSGGATVTVTITPCECQNPATVTVAPLAAICASSSTAVQLSATIGGGATSGKWTSNGTGTFDNATSISAKYTPSAGDVANGSVELTFTTNDPDGTDPKCIAALAKTTLSIKAKPAAPYNLRCNKEICLGESNKLFAVSPGNAVTWYATATSTTPIGVGSDDGFDVTPTAEGTFTYYAEAKVGDCISERSSISFVVKKCLTDLAVIKKVVDAPDAASNPDYLLGQTITYSIEAQNLGNANATDVKVDDILPAGATYVSSTPSGAYNNTTGVWSIGSLTNGSTKALLIQVTLNKVGSVANTAKISGTNEDPTKLANNTSTVTIKVADIADLSLTKTVSKSVVNVGEEIEYTITVLNSGPNTATNVEVKDKLPAGLTYVSSSTLTESAGTLTGSVASLAKGTSTSFTFKAKVGKDGKITNVAEISKADQKDPDSTPGNVSTKPNEDDDDSVDINSSTLCDLTKPTIACGCTQKTVCLGSSETLTASGCAAGATYIWSNGETGASITVTPKTNQTYTVYCKKDECKSEASNAVEIKVIVIDTPLLAAAPSKICAGESTVLTAKGCGGVVEWQTSPKQTGPQITVSPLVSTTYKAICKEFECTSLAGMVDVIVTPTPKAPEIVCAKGEICPGETITMTAINCNGQVKWSTGQETTTITVFPTVTTSYTVTCSVNGCTSEPSKPFVLTVKPIAVPVIKTSDLIVCTGGSATLTAEGCTGKVTWYYADKTLTGATIVVKPATTTTYYATCSSIACASDKSSPLTVQVVNPAPPIVSSGTSTICAGSTVELTATGCEGIVTWSDGQKGAVVTVKPLASTSYTATCTIGTCVSETSIKRSITVTDFAKPTITANKLTICAGESITMTANGCNGIVNWSDGVTGSPRTITPTADIKYTARCESATCKSDVSNELTIKVNVAGSAPAISATKTEICASETITLTATGCTGTVKWSDGSTGSTLTVKPSATTIYSAVCSTNTCDSPKSNEVAIKVNPAIVLNLIASANNEKVCADSEVTLTLAGCTGTVTWTGGLTGTSVKAKPSVTTTYTATCSGVACAKDASASVKVSVLPGASTPNITPTNTQICSGESVTLTANSCNGTLLWSNGATTASISVKPSVTTIYSVKCSVDGCGEAKMSEPVTVKVGTPEAPVVTSIPPSVCAGGQVVLTATGCISGTIVWSDGKTGNTVTETVNATTTYSAICKQGTCNSPESNKVIVTVTVPSVPTISCATSTVCAGSTITLVASGCEGTVKWSDGQTGTIVTATPSKTTDYTATCTVGTCVSAASSVATVNVGNPPAPSITCNATSICQGIQITLTGTNCTGTIVWNDGQVGNVITAKPNATTTYTAICKLDKCESGKSNPVTVTVGAGIGTPITKNLNNVCPFTTVDLASGVTSGLSAGGIFEYHTGVLPTSPLVSNPNAVGTGTYYVFEKTATGCYSSPGVINTFVNADCTPKDCAKTPATASAGADATICAEKTYKLAGTFGGAATSVTWKTTGSGSFDNPMLPTATYRSSLADVLAGTVKLIICTNDPDGSGPCKASADTMVLTMNGVKIKPRIAVNGNLNSCGSDSVTLTATTGAYEYKWFKLGTTTEIASTKSITVKNSGGYYFKLVDANKCCSIESDTVTVNYLAGPVAPIANSVKIDKGTTVDLAKLVVSNTPVGATLVFKTGANSSALTVANPSAVGAGVYYACYKSAQGCFSASTKITVENKDTGTPSKEADIEITVTTDNNIALDGTVKVTITVKNNGPSTAKGIDVTSPIPTGLTYVTSTGGLVVTGSNLNGSLDSLISGGVKVYTWVGKISGTTTTVVVGATGTTKTTDPKPSNNDGTNPSGKVTVSVPAPNSSDLVVTITTDKSTYAVNDTVTTTITVRNLGPATAKNVVVTSEVPDKLKYISQTGGLVVNGKVLTGKLDSLIRDGVKVYVFKSVLTGTGPVVLTGTGTSNNPDPNPNTNNGTGNGTTTINQNVPPAGADVVVTVTTDKTTYEIGDIVTTTITVKNNGPATAKGINVSSTLPSILEYIAQTGGLTKTGNEFTGTLDSLVKDGVKVYTYTAKVTAKGTATINAKSTSTTVDPNPNNNNGTGTGNTTTIKVGTEPSTGTGADVVITITTNKTTYAVGDTVTTTIKVTNLGPEVAKGISVYSVIPGTLTYVSQTGGLVKVGSLLTATIASLDKDGTVTYTYKSVLNTKSETVVAAGGTSTTKDPNPNNNNGTGTTGVVTINKGDVDPTVADVAIVITADKTTAAVGENVNFLLTLTNNGPATAKNVVFVNPIPAGLTFVSSTTGEVLTSGAITRTLDSLQKGQVRTYAYVAKMNVTTNVTNTVSVGSFKDNVGPNNYSFVTINGKTTIDSVDKAEVALTLTADKQLIKKDDEVTFTIKLTNNGPKTATNVVVDNILPKYLTFVSGDPSRVGDTLRAITATLANGETKTYTYKAKVNKDTIISNTARITKASPIDPILTNNVSTVVLVPATDTTYADLGILITANKATFKKDENVIYTVTLTNNGAGKVKDVELCGAFPSGLTFVSGTGALISGDSLKFKVDTLSKGRTRTFNYTAKATQVGDIANTIAICKSSKPDLIKPNNTSTVTIKVTRDTIPVVDCKVELAMAIIDTAKVSDGVYNVTYRLIAKNICKDTLKNVTLTNDLSKTFKTPVTCQITGKPSTGVRTNLIPNDLFSKTDTSLVKAGSYMLPNAIDTIKYVVKVTLAGNKGPFTSTATITGKTAPGNQVLTAKAKDVLRFDLPATRIGVAKEVVTTAVKNDSTTFWTVKYRIRVVNLGANAITKLSVRDSLAAVFPAKGAKIVGKPILFASQGLTINKNFTGVGKGDSTELLDPEKSGLGLIDSLRIGVIDVTVRVNVAGVPDADKTFNNVAIGTGTGTDKLTYRDVSTKGTDPDPDGDKDPSNNNEATPVTLLNIGGNKGIGLALAAVSDTIQTTDSTCNVTMILTAKNLGKDNLKKVNICHNLEKTIGKNAQSYKIVGTPRVLRGNAKINLKFDGKVDSTIVKSDSSFIASGDSIVIAYIVNIKRPAKDTILTQALVKAVNAIDSTKIVSDLSTNGLKPDVNGNGNAEEDVKTPIICKGAEIPRTTFLIPNGFSPNGDGINDGFIIEGIKPTERGELIIFNRWGGVVYASDDYKSTGLDKSKAWKGEANRGVIAVGKDQGLPDGTYFYCFTLKNRETGEKIGTEEIKSLTLLR